MRTITGLATNIKRPIGLTFLKPHIVFQGPTASGKTAALNAMQLALLGTAIDVAGRSEIRSPDLLGTLADDTKEHREPLFASVTLDDGTSASWKFEEKIVRAKPADEWLDLYGMVQDALFNHKTGEGVYTNGVPFLFEWFASPDALAPAPPVEAEGGLGPAGLERMKTFVGEHRKLDRKMRLLAVYGSVKKKITELNGKLKEIEDAQTCLRPEHAAPGVQLVLGNLTARREVKLQEKADCQKVADYVLRWMGATVEQLLPEIAKGARPFCVRKLAFRMAFGPAPLDAGSLLVGYERDGKFRPCTSGGETVGLVAAIAAYIAVRNEPQGLIVLPDRGFDQRTATALLRLLDPVPCNVFFQTTDMDFQPPEGWELKVFQQAS